MASSSHCCARSWFERMTAEKEREIQARCSVQQTAWGMPQGFALLRVYLLLYYIL